MSTFHLYLLHLHEKRDVNTDAIRATYLFARCGNDAAFRCPATATRRRHRVSRYWGAHNSDSGPFSFGQHGTQRPNGQRRLSGRGNINVNTQSTWRRNVPDLAPQAATKVLQQIHARGRFEWYSVSPSSCHGSPRVWYRNPNRLPIILFQLETNFKILHYSHLIGDANNYGMPLGTGTGCSYLKPLRLKV